MENDPNNVPVIRKKKQDNKYRRRDPKSVENIKKTLETMDQEKKVDYLLEKYGELYEEARDMHWNLEERKKVLINTEKELNLKHGEVAKLVITKGQLENLCREIQQQNKVIKEENIARIKEEEDRRREVANTFTERLTVLTNLITESKDKSNKFKEENQSMTDKLTELYKQSQQRENHIDTVTKQLELQKKLAETQAKKTEIEREAERQTFSAQKKTLEVQLEQYEREIVLLQEKNRSLEAQVDLYKSQYSDFETTMTKSNKVFDTFKQEMSKMSKQLRVLESERNDLRKRWQSSVNSLIVLSEQHMALANEQSSLEKKLTTLQKLCRQLQEERTAYLKQLKENNIKPIVPTVQNSENEKIEQSTKVAETADTSSTSKVKQEPDEVEEVAALITKDLRLDLPIPHNIQLPLNIRPRKENSVPLQECFIPLVPVPVSDVIMNSIDDLSNGGSCVAMTPLSGDDDIDIVEEPLTEPMDSNEFSSTRGIDGSSRNMQDVNDLCIITVAPDVIVISSDESQ